jgi:hypothetical protein
MMGIAPSIQFQGRNSCSSFVLILGIKRVNDGAGGQGGLHCDHSDRVHPARSYQADSRARMSAQDARGPMTLSRAGILIFPDVCLILGRPAMP